MAARLRVACVADEIKPRYSPSANQRPKACSVLPGFSIIGSYWVLLMAVLSCTVGLVSSATRARLRGIKQEKLIIHSSTLMLFFFSWKASKLEF